jgi:pimeloyl-ACP methyl ester carboxylesterase
MERSEELDYAHVLAQAKSAHNDRALAALADIGPPPYDDFFTKVGIERDWANELASGGDPAVAIIRRLPPGISPIDIDFFMRGMQFSSRQLGPRMSKIDLPSLGADFSIPIFFFEGTADQMTPVELAEQYFEMIKAPHKEFVRFEGDHHFVLFNRPNEFLTELVNRVRPLAVAADGE